MKRYGIRITLRQNDPMRAPHLLGENWESFRWYDSADERDRAMAEMQRHLPYYLDDEQTSQILKSVKK